MELQWIPGPCHSPSLILLAAPPARPCPGRTPRSGCLLGAGSSRPPPRRGSAAAGKTWAGPCPGDSDGSPRWHANTALPRAGPGRGVFQPRRGEFARSRKVGNPPPPPARRPRFHSLYFPVSGLHLHRREEEVALGQAEPAGSAAVPAPGGWHCGRRLPLRSRLPPTRAGRPQVKLALGFSVTHLTPLCPRPPTFLQGLLLPPTVLPL